MLKRTAFIIIDSGFSEESLSGLGTVLGACNLYDGRTASGAPWLDRETLRTFAGDPLNHGSLVLGRIRELAPGAPLVLIRACDDSGHPIHTGWANGRQVSPGWTEAYLWAVELCRKLGLSSVANCSFGGFEHAMDGTGWESLRVGQASGSGSPGHVLVAAAGPGDGRAAHASWLTGAGETTTVHVLQADTTEYNFWASVPPQTPGGAAWSLEIWSQDRLLERHDGQAIPVNFWNGRQQLTFTVEGDGVFELRLRRAGLNSSPEWRFDCWILSNDNAAFLNHVDSTLIAEPAVFPQVIAVGLKSGSYSPLQALAAEKPDVLLPGTGPISFHLPEVTVTVARLLEADPRLDVWGVRALLGKLPQLPAHNR